MKTGSFQKNKIYYKTNSNSYQATKQQKGKISKKNSNNTQKKDFKQNTVVQNDNKHNTQHVTKYSNKQISKKIISNKCDIKDRGNLDKNNTQSVGEKAYNLLAKQENISINKAKNLIDSGMVSAKGVRIKIGRIILPNNTKFEVMQPLLNTIFENEDLLILDKGVGIESYSLEQQYSPYKLINRLDRDTSGIILLAKNKEVRKRAISEFKQRKVHKIYLALVSGKIHDEIKINKRINTDKNTHATSYIATTGKDALSIVQPLRILNGNTFVQIDIPTGRTHQIRIHLASIKHPIIGDILYGNDSIASKRLMLHCHKTSLLGYEFVSKLNVEKEFGIE